jgi:hypothetical protein
LISPDSSPRVSLQKPGKLDLCGKASFGSYGPNLLGSDTYVLIFMTS